MPHASNRRHQTRNIVSAVCEAGWAIDVSKMGAIIDILEMRSAGLELSREEIAARIGPRAGDDEPRMQVLGGVAVLELFGVLAPRMDAMVDISGGTSMQAFGALFEAALASSEVKSIVIDIDSPGGTFAGAKELADLIYAARGKKPIVAVANLQAASGAYWIGTSAEELVVSPSSSVGSIGVVAVQSENSKANDAAGIKFNVISAGEHKADGNPYEPLKSSARDAMQARINDMYAAFVADVARNRNVTIKQVEENFGQGQVFLAPRAVALGIADRVATLEQVIRELSGGATRSSRPRLARPPAPLAAAAAAIAAVFNGRAAVVR